MIISVHMPKTGGASFGAALSQRFGDKFLRDYSDYPVNTAPYERNKSAMQSCLRNLERDYGGIVCIHGHFLPIKYLLLSQVRNVRFVTWMRDPMQRLLSHYCYWKKNYHPEKALPLHKRVVEEDWSLERFCLASELRNLYSQFLFGFPLEYFCFVGITEYYEEDFRFFSSSFLKQDSEPVRLNVSNTSGNYNIDESLEYEVQRFHSEDIELYQRALKKRMERYACCPSASE